jgi:hypothetical protein
MVELCLHSPIGLRGVVLNYLCPAMTLYQLESMKRKYHLGGLGVNRRILLKWVLEE